MSNLKCRSLFLAFSLLCVTSALGGEQSSTPTAASHSPQPSEAQRAASGADSLPDIPDDAPEEDLAPAAVQLDLSSASPLIRSLYQATRETKEQDILAQLDQAKTLIESGADLKATDPQGRTALHWAVFGSSYNTK